MRIRWRVPNATSLIPNYESQPIKSTVLDQLSAAGMHILGYDGEEWEEEAGKGLEADILFLVNNFAQSVQLEASQQTSSPSSDYDRLLGSSVRVLHRALLFFFFLCSFFPSMADVHAVLFSFTPPHTHTHLLRRRRRRPS